MRQMRQGSCKSKNEQDAQGKSTICVRFRSHFLRQYENRDNVSGIPKSPQAHHGPAKGLGAPTADGNRLPVPLHAGMSPFRLFLLDHCKFLILVQAMAAQRPSPPPDSAASCPATSSSTDAEIGWLQDGYSNF
jgi:hypothetical protein